MQSDHTSAGPFDLRSAVALYLADVRARTRAATLANYQTALLSSLLPWCDRHRVTRVDQLDQDVVNRWVSWLREEYRTEKGKPLAEATQRTYVTAVGFWLAWLRRRGAVDAEVKARAPKRRPRVIDVLTRAEIQQLEEGATTERDKLLIRVLADTGARLQEVLDLREQDLVEPVRRQWAVKLGGKTGQRLVPVTPALARRLRAYIERGRPKNYHGTRVFVGQHTVKDRYTTPGRTTIARMIREAGERAGLQKRVYAHLLRHSGITNLLRSGANPIVVAQIAGHSSLETIRTTYAHLTLDDAQAAMMRALLADEDD